VNSLYKLATLHNPATPHNQTHMDNKTTQEQRKKSLNLQGSIFFILGITGPSIIISANTNARAIFGDNYAVFQIAIAICSGISLIFGIVLLIRASRIQILK
jgi:hypothetical protein